MATEQYTAVVTVDGKTFVGTIPLTYEEYTKFLLQEYNAVEHVLELLRPNPTHQGREFDGHNVTLYPQY